MLDLEGFSFSCLFLLDEEDVFVLEFLEEVEEDVLSLEEVEEDVLPLEEVEEDVLPLEELLEDFFCSTRVEDDFLLSGDVANEVGGGEAVLIGFLFSMMENIVPSTAVLSICRLLVVVLAMGPIIDVVVVVAVVVVMMLGNRGSYTTEASVTPVGPYSFDI